LIALCIEHIHEAVSAAHINPAALGVDKHIVGIAAGVRAGYLAAVGCSESSELRRIAEGHEHVIGGIVHCERIIASVSQLPE